jgi:hypothetical protein
MAHTGTGSAVIKVRWEVPSPPAALGASCWQAVTAQAILDDKANAFSTAASARVQCAHLLSAVGVCVCVCFESPPVSSLCLTRKRHVRPDRTRSLERVRARPEVTKHLIEGYPVPDTSSTNGRPRVGALS